jgi:hypothetical protein
MIWITVSVCAEAFSGGQLRECNILFNMSESVPVRIQTPSLNSYCRSKIHRSIDVLIFFSSVWFLNFVFKAPVVIAVKLKLIKNVNLPAYLLTNWLTLWSWALLERPPVVQPLKNLPAFSGTRISITTFTRDLHFSLSWARPIQSITPILSLQDPS